MSHKNYIIIGNGIAAHSASMEIRKNDPTGSVLIITTDREHTYYRLKLTEYIAHPIPKEKLYLMNDDVAKDKNIEVALGTSVQEIHPEKKEVVTSDGQTYTYDKLLIATGSSPFVPPTKGKDKDHVLTIRNLSDVERLHEAFSSVDTMVVIGGGLLGLEAAWSLMELGKKVHVVEMAPYLLPRQLDQSTASLLQESLEKSGLSIHTQASVEEIYGEGDVEGVRLQDGTEIPCGGVLFNIGVRPNISLAQDAGLETNRGIVVNERMETSEKDIFAAGDCVEYNGMTFGLWTASNTQGKMAGANMTGGDEKYTNPKLFTSLKLGETQLFSSGNVQDYDEIKEFHNDDNHLKKFFFTGKKPTGAILFGDIRQMGMVNRVIDGDLDFETYENEHLR